MLVALYSGICFATMPVNAQINIQSSTYKPDIIYLGRQSHLEYGGFPSDLYDPETQYIYALVHDAYGQKVNGSLTYTIFYNNTIYHHTIYMKLINGIPTNGTWMIEIPKPQKVNKPYTVHYYVTFKDDLNYSVTKAGPYYNYNDYTDNYYNFMGRNGYYVTNRYIVYSLHHGQDPTWSCTAMVSSRTNMPQVTLYYKLNNRWIPEAMHPTNDTSTSMNPYSVENQSGFIHRFYSTVLNVPSGTKEIQIYPTLHDSEGNLSYPSVAYARPYNEYTDSIIVRPDVSNIDVGNKTADMRITLDGLVRDKLIVQRHVWDLENIPLTLIDNNNNNVLRIPGSFLGQTDIVFPEKFRSFHAKIGTGTLKLAGNSTSFPYDKYSLNFTIGIPLKVGIIPKDPVYEASYRTKWDVPSPLWKYNITSDPQTGNKLLKIYMEFNRNNFYATTLILPILLVFFLLGIACLLEPEGHNLVARIAITLGVFTFVFTFDVILPQVKPSPIQGVSTFTEFLLKLVLVAAIASTISSVMGAVMKKIPNEWIQRIHKYRLYDVLAAVLVLGIGIYELGQYSFEYSPWFIVIIFVGLAWGLLCHVIFQYHKMQKEGQGRKIPLLASLYDVNKEDELKARKIMNELEELKKAEELREEQIQDLRDGWKRLF